MFSNNTHNNAINHRAFNALDFKPQAVFAGYCGRYVSVMKLIFISISYILMLGCNSSVIANQKDNLPSAQASGQVSAMQISAFKAFKALKKGMLEQEVYSLVGLPTRHSGHGVAYDVYKLQNNSEVWIAWQKGKTSWAFIKKSNQQKITLFE